VVHHYLLSRIWDIRDRRGNGDVSDLGDRTGDLLMGQILPCLVKPTTAVVGLSSSFAVMIGLIIACSQIDRGRLSDDQQAFGFVRTREILAD